MNGKVATTEKLQRPECLLRQYIGGTILAAMTGYSERIHSVFKKQFRFADFFVLPVLPFYAR
jgi:hypothetical protein